MLMAVVGWLCVSAGKRPDTDTILTIKCLLPLIIDLEGLERSAVNWGRERSIQTRDVEESVLDCIEENPGVSMRQKQI